MRTLWLSLVILVLAVTVGRTEQVEHPHVTVYGAAERMVAPDQIVWSLIVKNKGPSLDAVAGDHTRITDRVIRLLTSVGVEKENVQTSGMRFGENRVYRQNRPIKEGYYASTDIVFELTDFDRYQHIWSKLAEFEEVSIRGAHYALSDPAPHRNAMMNKALLNAKKKAADMANSLGVRIGGPVAVEEISTGHGPIRRVDMLRKATAAESVSQNSQMATAPGKIKVRAQVRVVFRLIDPSR